MKRQISFIVIISVCTLITAQNKDHIFKIMNVTPGGVKISSKEVIQYDSFNETEFIKWLKDDASMVVKPLFDIPYTDCNGKKDIWYKGITAKVSATDRIEEKTNNMFWWMKLNRTSTKGGALFDREYEMYEDELIIELPEIFKDGEGYKFVSLTNDKSFYCEYDNEKPLIRITRKMLDSIGFNGKSITIQVFYMNNYNEPKLISNSMVIKYRK